MIHFNFFPTRIGIIFDTEGQTVIQLIATSILF